MTETDLLAAADDTATEEVRNMLDSQIVNGDGVIAGFRCVCEKCGEKVVRIRMTCRKGGDDVGNIPELSCRRRGKVIKWVQNDPF
jgi:uncharacterized OB-fold protein